MLRLQIKRATGRRLSAWLFRFISYNLSISLLTSEQERPVILCLFNHLTKAIDVLIPCEIINVRVSTCYGAHHVFRGVNDEHRATLDATRPHGSQKFVTNIMRATMRCKVLHCPAHIVLLKRRKVVGPIHTIRIDCRSHGRSRSLISRRVNGL